MSGGVTQVVEHLPRASIPSPELEPLSSNPSTTKKKNHTKTTRKTQPISIFSKGTGPKFRIRLHNSFLGYVVLALVLSHVCSKAHGVTSY
jgi:hypothetical protein